MVQACFFRQCKLNTPINIHHLCARNALYNASRSLILRPDASPVRQKKGITFHSDGRMYRMYSYSFDQQETASPPSTQALKAIEALLKALDWDDYSACV